MTEIPHNYGWLTDILDIGIVAVIIYRLLLFLKGTEAARMLSALAVVLAVYFISLFADFRTVTWLVDNLFASLIVVLVILFQGDIRRALASAGRNRTGREKVRHEAHAVIEELVTAAEGLAAKKIGALIVIERDMDVEPFLTVGTDIDAKVTSELLTSIFLPYSPIHDGAVIIQKGKLTRAGCLLPLTQNPDVSKALGTRHRAAIGLTETTDALVLVVSEETGGISVVVGGKITRDLPQHVLRKVLHRLLDVRWLQ